MQIYCNIPLNLRSSLALYAAWFQPIPHQHKTLTVFNRVGRTALNLGSLDLPASASSFSGSLEYYADKALPAIIIGENDPFDTKEVGLFLCKTGSVEVISGQAIFDSGGFSLETYRTGEFGQMLVVEVGTILAVNNSNFEIECPPEFWKFDGAAGGWALIQIWESGLQLKPL